MATKPNLFKKCFLKCISDFLVMNVTLVSKLISILKFKKTHTHTKTSNSTLEFELREAEKIQIHFAQAQYNSKSHFSFLFVDTLIAKCQLCSCFSWHQQFLLLFIFFRIHVCAILFLRATGVCIYWANENTFSLVIWIFF